ncbi:MAG TPA: hypothetical protein VNJ02_15840 [Vicinamibacterales bacterium]|nr:hypothetical protein [Vicinamibacterales bacterium]
MTLTPTLRKFFLTAHIVVSVGWLGAIVAYLGLAILGLTTDATPVARNAYLAMAFIGWYVLVPFSLSALAGGLIVSLTTQWGLFKHWWVVAKLVATTAATIVLLRHMQTVTQMAALASRPTFDAAVVHPLRVQLVVHAAGGLLVLAAVTALSVYKPVGMTPYAKRARQVTRQESTGSALPGPIFNAASTRTAAHPPRWGYVIGLHAIALAIVFVVFHLTGGRFPSH